MGLESQELRPRTESIRFTSNFFKSELSINIESACDCPWDCHEKSVRKYIVTALAFQRSQISSTNEKSFLKNSSLLKDQSMPQKEII